MSQHSPLVNPIRRQKIRQPVEGQAELREAGSRSTPIRLLDISEQGCRITLVNRARPGTVLWIRLPGLESIESIVRWEDEFTAGLEFRRPLYPAVLTHLMQLLDK